MTGTNEVWEFSAGSGALAEHVLQILPQIARFTIVDFLGSLRARQQHRLKAFEGRVRQAATLPDFWA